MLLPLVKAAFTLLETLVVFAVLTVLVAVVIPTTSRVSRYAARTKVASNLRQLGVAAHLYANDHDQALPGHPSNNLPADADKSGTWPQLFCGYLSPSDPRVLLDPEDRQTAGLPADVVLSETTNHTGYLYNGFDDLSSAGRPLGTIPLNLLPTPSQTILLATKIQGATGFYADVLFRPLSDLLVQFNPAAYGGGAYYLFVDGSVRYLKQAEYSNSLWLTDKSIRVSPQLDLRFASHTPTIAEARRQVASPGMSGGVMWR